MSEPTAQIPVTCPSCSPTFETAHEVLRRGGQATVRCTECGHVHKTSLETASTVERNVVVSQDGESFTATVDAPAEETVAVGEEFLVETDEAILTVRITSLEADDRRVEAAPVEEVETLWTRAVGNVSVNVTVHPSDGRHDRTRSVTLQLPGDYEFTVGEETDVAGERFRVEGIHLRDDASGYEFEKLDHRGDAAVAKDVNRLYARDTGTTSTRPAW